MLNLAPGNVRSRFFIGLQLSVMLALLASGLSAAFAQPALAASTCDVTRAKLLSQGGDQDWSSANGLIAHDKMDSSGVYQLHTINPDGTGQKCLSCTRRSGGPRVDRHKNNPTWHPSGRYIVVQGEMDDNPLFWARDKYTAELILNGLWTNLYATTADGAAWFRLTSYSWTEGSSGAMAPHFSADGRKLLWSHLVETPKGQNAPWGTYRLMIADFIDNNGTPGLRNVRDITPSSGGSFFESHGFSPDGAKVIFASDRGTSHQWGMDLWAMDLATGALANLTHSDSWEEHAGYSPDGRSITYMSSAPYDITTWLTLGLVQSGTELLMMNSDGSKPRQLTHFNVPGFPESDTARRSMPHRPNWSADGRSLVLTRQLAGAEYPSRQLWMLTFAGPCGGSATPLSPAASATPSATATPAASPAATASSTPEAAPTATLTVKARRR